MPVLIKYAKHVPSHPVLTPMPLCSSEHKKIFSPGIFTMLTMKSHTLSSVIIGKLAELYHHCSHTSITWPGVATEEHFGSGQLRQWT